jgi:hypothetical protein
MRKLVIACLIQFALLMQAHAWGPEGHSIVAEIAQRRLSPEAAAKVREILGENASLGIAPRRRKATASFTNLPAACAI